MEQTFTTEHILETKEFADFYTNANQFCDFIENDKSANKFEFLKTSRQHLLNIYNQALHLPWVDLQSNMEYDDNLDNNEFDKTISFISKRLEDFRYYWHLFDPTKHDDKNLLCGDLLDDLGDIYRDLKYTIMIFNLNKVECKENALWQFKFDFDRHWNYHCVSALNAIHFFLQTEN